MDFNNNLFGTTQTLSISIPETSQIVFVSDLFVEDYSGGAELTTEAIIKSSPFEVYKLHSQHVTMELLQQGQNKFWIFGNFSQMDLNLIPAIMANMQYSVVEYDYKCCKYRSIEKHKELGKEECNCHNETHGKLVAAFFRGARHLWWMSEKQMKIYHDLYPFLKTDTNNTVLSSVFSDETLAQLRFLRESFNKSNKERKGWVVLGSQSWVKGYDDARNYCINNNLEYDVVWNKPYADVLTQLASSEGFVYLPKGNDTCPRMVIEAKLLGCELVLNDYVQHKDEEWFNPEAKESSTSSDEESENIIEELSKDDEITQIEQYLYAARSFFWNGTKADMEWRPTISGYTTTKDCVSQKYPFEASINSMLEFCNEVVVMDGGSSDETYEILTKWAEQEPKLKVFQEKMNWDDPRFALFDGKLKDMARSKCTMEFCWQQDSDEVVHEEDVGMISAIAKNFPPNIDLVALPVIEYWGGQDKVRADIFPWKWRFSRNKSHIGHGVPKQLRKFDELGMYSAPGSDGCDFIHRETGEIIPFGNFYTRDVEVCRQNLQTNDDALKAYQEWFGMVTSKMPSVFHFSWWNIERKIGTYKNYWGKHWKSLYNFDVEDTAENNVMFEVPWSEVTPEMMSEKAKELKEKTSGWIFHNKWSGQETRGITSMRTLPKFIQDWAKENEQKYE